jgi:plastocyanin
MGWIPDMVAERRRQARFSPPANIERLETRALLATVNVQVVNFAFNPDPVQIHVGDTVHWVWATDDHSTTSVSGQIESWDSGVHNSGFTFDHTFTHAGSFVYYCVIHGSDNGNGTASGMSGTIIVSSVGNPTSIAVTPSNPTIAAGSTEQFMAMGAFPDGSMQDLTNQVTWAAATSSVATISSTGLATGVANGSTSITASLNGVVGSTTLTVAGTPTPPLPPSIGRFKSHGLKIQAKLDKTYHGYVLYFSEPNSIARDFHAFIDWGDKSKIQPGHIHDRGNDHYAIIGAHRYVAVGSYTISVKVRNGIGKKIANQSPVHVIY